MEKYLYVFAIYQGKYAQCKRRLLNPEHLVVLLTGPTSHTGTQYIDYVEILKISLDLSTIYFAHFSGW